MHNSMALQQRERERDRERKRERERRRGRGTGRGRGRGRGREGERREGLRPRGPIRKVGFLSGLVGWMPPPRAPSLGRVKYLGSRPALLITPASRGPAPSRLLSLTDEKHEA